MPDDPVLAQNYKKFGHLSADIFYQIAIKFNLPIPVFGNSTEFAVDSLNGVKYEGQFEIGTKRKNGIIRIQNKNYIQESQYDNTYMKSGLPIGLER